LRAEALLDDPERLPLELLPLERLAEPLLDPLLVLLLRDEDLPEPVAIRPLLCIRDALSWFGYPPKTPGNPNSLAGSDLAVRVDGAQRRPHRLGGTAMPDRTERDATLIRLLNEA
jgi:hypothetical protein